MRTSLNVVQMDAFRGIGFHMWVSNERSRHLQSSCFEEKRTLKVHFSLVPDFQIIVELEVRFHFHLLHDIQNSFKRCSFTACSASTKKVSVFY